MPVQPLSVILLLLFLLFVAASLTAWFALAQDDRAQERQEDADEIPAAPAVRLVSNDETRGARVRPDRTRRNDEEDPFERFIRSKNDDVKL